LRLQGAQGGRNRIFGHRCNFQSARWEERG
jgi:hypothetical protein